ncbi:hypothetical protein PMAYCL1PPCAC_26871, partial [Pristionchus mayeri]
DFMDNRVPLPVTGRLARLDTHEDAFTSACQSVRTNRDLCPFGCGKLLAPRTIDYHRLNGCRGKQEDAFADLSRKRSFTCGACYEEFVTREAFFSHLTHEHAVEATIRTEVFPDQTTFERFRYWLEAQGGAHFRQKSGAKNRPTGKGIFMMCNRSGLVHTTAATGEPDKDKLGSYRVGYTCTAFINGTIYPDGHVSVRYCGDHYGHDARVRIPQSVKNLIMHMQGEGKSNGAIIRFLQDRFIPLGHSSIHAQRAAYVDLEELRSITPMLRKLSHIPYEKEEEWEQELLESAGIARRWGPPYPPRQIDWLPTRELAKQLNWPHPFVFKAKIRNSSGEWMTFDEERGVYVRDTTRRTPVLKAQHHFLEDLGHPYMVKEEREVGRVEEDGMEEAGEEDVDVEDLREKTPHEMPEPLPVASTSSAASPPSSTKKRARMEGGEGVVKEGEGAGRTEDEEGEGETEAENGQSCARRSAFLASSIVAELDMIRALVKGESDCLSEAELAAYLKQTRALRLSFEPLPRRDRSTRDFAVPQLARPSRVLPIRGRTRSSAAAFQHRSIELRSPFGDGGSGWAALAAASDAASSSASVPGASAARKRGASMMSAEPPHEIDACDEAMITGRKLQYNSLLWS